MEINVEFEEMRRRWDELLERAASGARVVVTVDGEPIGALVGEEDMQFLLQHRRQPHGPEA